MLNRTAAAIHIALLAAQLFFLVSPPFPGRRTLCVATIISLAIATHLVGPPSDIPGDAQAFALLWPIYLGTLDKFLCAKGDGPENSYWRVDRPAREARAMMLFGPTKMKWAAALMFNTRGVRWNYEVKKLPPKPRMSRRQFLFWQTGDFVKLFLMSDLLLQLSERLFWTPADDIPKHVDSKNLTISHPDWRWSFFKVLAFACGPYFFVDLQYVTASIVAVGLNLSRVEDWPPYFRNVSEVTTVRHFWGSFWHQTLRRSLTKATGFTVDFLSIPRGTNLSSYLQIWLAFAISGFMHAQSMLLLPHPSNITFSERTVGVMAFFMWQAAAITMEDFVQWLWSKYSGGREASPWISRFVGYAWVIWSFWVSLPWAADVMMRIRLTEESFLGFSMLRSIIQRVPIPP
ncbi:membrane bound O-acyl transferase family-domain-containing protein [Hypoxylon cercidicola]|nr:membrane bound O-acyl transferase family-domain-containing protein [Hypoxylon cercidicola]